MRGVASLVYKTHTLSQTQIFSFVSLEIMLKLVFSKIPSREHELKLSAYA